MQMGKPKEGIKTDVHTKPSMLEVASESKLASGRDLCHGYDVVL